VSESEKPEPKELTAPAPTNEALLRRYDDSLATSAKDIQRGQAIFLDRHGMPFVRSRFNRLVGLLRLGIFGSFIGGAVLFLSGSWVGGSLLYLLGSLPTISSAYRGTGALMAIGVLARQGNLDEAQRRLDAISHVRRRSPAEYCFLAGNLASHRGEYAAAIALWREGLPRTKGLARMLVTLSIAKALLLSGQTKEARLTFETVTLPPNADDILFGHNLARVMFALLDPSTDPMPDDELHDRARRLLEYSHTGVDLAVIGWVFEKRGDADMASWLAGEALERMHYPYLATWWPALQQWLDERSTERATDLL
jgi:hypothetical protein